jgi:hypothetical protein
MIAVYLDTSDSLLLMSKDHTYHALFYILKQSDSERNLWYADKKNKDIIMEKMQISTPTLAKHIASLAKRNILIHDGIRGRYRLNMRIFSL